MTTKLDDFLRLDVSNSCNMFKFFRVTFGDGSSASSSMPAETSFAAVVGGVRGLDDLVGLGAVDVLLSRLFDVSIPVLVSFQCSCTLRC